MTSTSEPNSTAKAPLPPLPYSDGVTLKLNKQQNEINIRTDAVTSPEYIADPSGNEATNLLVPIPAAEAAGILNSQDRSWRRRKRLLFFTIILLALYLIYRRRIHYLQEFHSKELFPGYEYPPEGLIPEYEFEDPVSCVAEASTPVYPDNRLITIPGDASKFALTVLGVGIGRIELEIVDDLVGGIEVETHFHIPPGTPTDSVSVDYVYEDATGQAKVVVNTPRCLPIERCSEDYYDADSVAALGPQPEDTWHCVAVASRVRVPRPPANASVPELRLSAQHMSINARLHSPGSDPVLVAGLAAVTGNGGVAVSGPATIAGSADGHFRLESHMGSIRVVDVDVASEVPLSVGTNSGSIFLE
ncbi:hypothetical protein HK405_001038, partial [Cladochytrium tenue]